MSKKPDLASRILVVDDDEDIRQALVCQLLIMGYEVDQASNGCEALDIVSRGKIDGMLLDVRMPLMDGWTMLEQLHKRYLHIPTIVMSADAPGETAPKARDYGAQGYLPKPYNFSHLQTTCLRVFGELPISSLPQTCSH